MAVKIIRSIFRSGHQEGGDFNVAGQPGAWFTVTVDVDWPEMDRDGDIFLPRVIVTPLLENSDAVQQGSFVIGWDEHASTLE